jgi:hypothetical protein
VVATRQVGFGGSSPSLTQYFNYSTTWTPADPAKWTQKNTTVCTTDDVRGSSVCTAPTSVPANAFLTAYAYTPINTSLNDMFEQTNYPPQMPLESSPTDYNWGSTSSVAKTVYKWWNGPYRPSQTVGGSIRRNVLADLQF